MELTFKHRAYELQGWDVYDDAQSHLFFVKSNSWWHWDVSVCGADGKEIGSIKQKNFSFQYLFNLYTDGLHIGDIKYHATLSNPYFTLDHLDWKIEGNVWNNLWLVTDRDNNLLMEINREWVSFQYTYSATLLYPEHAFICTLIVMAISMTFRT